MSAPELHDCAICENKTNQMCSACEAIYFCSRECQKLAFPVHRWLCTQPTDYFSFPPLSEADVKYLPKLRISYLKGNGSHMLEDLRQTTGLVLSWSEFVQILRSDRPAPPYKHPFTRNFLLMHTRDMLMVTPEIRNRTTVIDLDTLWMGISAVCRPVVEVATKELDEPEEEHQPTVSDPFTTLNSVFRQYALAMSLAYSSAKTSSPVPVVLESLHLAHRRLKTTSDSVPASPKLRAALNLVVSKIERSAKSFAEVEARKCS